jgi:hypothetical protein
MNDFRQDLLHSLGSLSLFPAILVVYSYLTEMIFQLLMNQSSKEMLGSGDGPEMGVQPPLVPSLIKQASQLFEIDIWGDVFLCRTQSGLLLVELFAVTSS